MDVLKHIEDLQHERGWSTYKLAEMSGLTGSTLTNMFNRKTLPSLTTLYALCDAFEITMSEFFQTLETDEPTPDELNMLKKFRQLNYERKRIVKDIINQFQASDENNNKLL